MNIEYLLVNEDGRKSCSHWPTFKLRNLNSKKAGPGEHALTKINGSEINIKDVEGYGLDEISSRRKTTIIVTLYSDHPSASNIENSYQRLQSDLYVSGCDVNIVFLNNYVPYNCLERCYANCVDKVGNCFRNDSRLTEDTWYKSLKTTSNITYFQDTSNDNIWGQLRANQYDAYIYDRDRYLFYYFNSNSSVSDKLYLNSDISSPIGYNTIRTVTLLACSPHYLGRCMGEGVMEEIQALGSTIAANVSAMGVLHSFIFFLGAIVGLTMIVVFNFSFNRNSRFRGLSTRALGANQPRFVELATADDAERDMDNEHHGSIFRSFRSRSPA